MKHPALLVTLAALTGCTDTRSTTLTPELEAVVDSNTAFALDLYQRSAAEHENLILSPMSISSVLSMTMAGAAGETAAELGDVLRVDVDEQDTYHEQFGGLMQDLDGRFDGYQINIANQLFGTASIPWNDDFIALNEQDYGAPLQETDFSNSEGARRDINRWVKRQTSGMIPELLQPDQLNAATVLVLANAIYFQGDWAEAFDPDDTQPKDFTTLDGSQSRVDMMHVTADAGYFEDDAVQIGRLPYQGDETSLFIVLPAAEDGLEEIEKSLTVEQLAAWDASLTTAEVSVELPRLTIESRLDLKATLIDMGMASAFSPVTADFSGMTEQPLHLDFVVHEAIVEVEEDGTKAAAATAAGISFSTSEVSAPESLVADHPFLFFIRDDLSGAILFAGRVTAP